MIGELSLVEFVEEAIAETFREVNTRRQEDRDPTALTLSGLGGCTRRNAYAVARVPASDVHPPEEARQALLGTGIHDWLLPALARVITRLISARCDVEKRVALHAAGIRISGHLDLAFNDAILDLKTVREHKLHGVRRHGPYGEHRVQVNGYGLAEYQTGRPVRWIVYLYMDRTTGEVHPVAEPFDNAAALAVIDRVETIHRFAATDPDAAPREARGPGVSLACDRCPWLRRCWGPNAKPGKTGPQTQLAATPAGLVEILRLSYAATAAASSAHADKEFAKLVLADTPDGQYGPFRLSRGRDSQMDDTDQIKRILAELGIEVPRKPKAGGTYVRLARPDGNKS